MLYFIGVLVISKILVLGEFRAFTFPKEFCACRADSEMISAGANEMLSHISLAPLCRIVRSGQIALQAADESAVRFHAHQ